MRNESKVQLVAKSPKLVWSKGFPLWICLMGNGHCASGGTDGQVRMHMDLSDIMREGNNLENYEVTGNEFEDDW
jgi:hypothetical protein